MVQEDVGTGESAGVLTGGLSDYSLPTRTFSARGPLGPWPTV